MALESVRMTSFKVQDTLDYAPYSVAVYQPKGCAFEKIAWTDIRDPDDGRWIRPREFVNRKYPADAYWEAILDHYHARLFEAQEWAETAPKHVAMLCWCPYDRAAQRQIKEFGTFICHTGPLAEFLVHELQVGVSYDHDRSERMFGVAD